MKRRVPRVMPAASSQMNAGHVAPYIEEGWVHECLFAAAAPAKFAVSYGGKTLFLQNRKLVKRKTDPEYTGDGPAQDEKSWRHAVAVRNGFILDQNDLKISTRWLWLNDKSTPDREKRLYAGHTQSLQNYDLHGRRLLGKATRAPKRKAEEAVLPGFKTKSNPSISFNQVPQRSGLTSPQPLITHMPHRANRPAWDQQSAACDNTRCSGSCCRNYRTCGSYPHHRHHRRWCTEQHIFAQQVFSHHAKHYLRSSCLTVLFF